MALSRLQSFGAAAMAALSIGAAANDSFAGPQNAVLPSQMSMNQCISRDAMLAGLEAERQAILVAGDALAINAHDGSQILQRQAYTANPTFDRGYVISQNLSGEFCKVGELTDIRLFDARVGRADAAAYYRPTSVNANGSLNAAINTRMQNRSELPMLQANSSTGLTITVLGNNSSNSGVVLFSNNSGTLNGTGFYDTANTRYSPAALSYLDRPQQNASLNMGGN